MNNRLTDFFDYYKNEANSVEKSYFRAAGETIILGAIGLSSLAFGMSQSDNYYILTGLAGLAGQSCAGFDVVNGLVQIAKNSPQFRKEVRENSF
jgi:hypothetical protein